MAGKKQHILPQFLLAGFVSRLDRGEPLIWVYRQDGKVFETSVNGFGYENYFYGSDKGGINADPQITALEGQYSKEVSELRAVPNGTDVSHTNVAEIVGHMSSRTKHLRDSFIETSDELITRAANHYSDDRVMQSYIRRRYDEHPQLLFDAVDETISKMSLSRPQRRIAKRKILGMGKVRLIEYIISANPDIGRDAFKQFSAVREIIPEAVRESHIKTLAKNLVATPRVEEYRTMSWFVVETESNFILGDVACLFTTRKNRGYRTYAGADEGITGIFLPISSKKLVVGVSDGQLPIVDVDAFNNGMAQKSRDFFVTNSESEYAYALLHQLGSDSALLSVDELTTIITSDFATEL